jgi:lipopolysaccharide transport system ATP-binding protein
MDEVLAVGDVRFQEKCIKKMKSLANEGRTILYVSHNMNTVRQLCDRCIVLDKGEKVYEGEIEGAINVYTGTNSAELNTQIDFSSLPRTSDITRDIKMLSFKIKNKDNNIFESNEPLEFTVEWQSKKDLQNIKFEMRLKNSNDMPVGFAFSESIEKVQKERIYTSSFKFDISNLLKEKYSVGFGVSQNDSMGNNIYLDFISRAFCFEIIKDSCNVKNKKSLYWGSVKFNDISVKTQ